MKKKLLFISPSIGFGGAEKNILFLCKNMCLDYDITLIIQNYSKVKIDKESFKVIELNKNKFRNALPGILINILRINPNFIFSSSGHINLFLGFLKTLYNVKTIIRESSIPSLKRNYTSSNFIPLSIEKYFINKNDFIICQSEDMFKDFFKIFQPQKSKVFLINNPVTLTDYVFKKTSNKCLKIITIGSLREVKGYFRVLNSISKLEMDYEYNIIGEGHLKKEISNVIKNTPTLKGKVNLIGQKEDIYSYIKNADLFILGSFIEGFPNVLLESLSCGVPCIAFSSSTGGQKEIIKEGFNGYLCNDEEELLKVIVRSIHKEWNHQEIINDINLRYSKTEILNKYHAIFKN